MENSMEVSQKDKYRTDPTISLLGIYPEKNEYTYLKIYMYSNVHFSTIYNS